MSIQRAGKQVASAGLNQWFSYDGTTSTGLTFGYKAGHALKAGVLTSIAAGTVVMSAGGLNYIYVNLTATPVVQSSLTQPVANAVILYTVEPDGVELGEVVDYRNWTTGVADAV